MKIGVLGSGDVAKTLGAGFVRHGHDVVMGTRDVAKLAEWAGKNPQARVRSFADAARHAEVAVLAVKGTAAADAVRAAGAANLAGKVVIDATNPIADAPPANGVLTFFTDLNDSLMEKLQREFHEVRFVKAFNSVGNACMVNPIFAGGKPTMFICGNDDAAKKACWTARSVRVGVSRHGQSRSRARDRTALHAVVHSRIFANDWVHAFKLLT
jgi:predicted dinucleotide-binding enzyme